jgi:multidrug efflux pump subunit AcrA (membrane-fusion protein)
MSYFKNHKKIMYIFGGIIILLAIILPRVFRNNNSLDKVAEYKSLVSLISVDDYLGNIRQIDTNATIESKGQIEIRAQISAPVQSLNVGIGDAVYAGQTLLVLKNDDIVAQVSQARANLASAEARLADTKKGTRAEEMTIYEQQYKNAERDMNNAVRDAYTKIEDATRNKTDILFTNAASVNPDLIVRTESRAIQQDINFKRLRLGEQMKLWKGKFFLGDNITRESEAEISAIISYSKNYFDTLANIIGDLSVGNSGMVQSTIDGYRNAVSGAQMQVNGASAAYSGAVSAWKVSGDNLSLKKAGATTEQLVLAEASVSQAQAALQGVQSVYNKSVIVSPISGSVSVLPFRVGDLVSPNAIIAGVVNDDGLELKGYISSEDASYVKEGDRVLIDDKYKAIISRISPSVDTQTKKVEIRIAVSDVNTNLVIGGISNVKIYSVSTTTDSVYTLPISSVNISNSGAHVYTLATTTDDVSMQTVVAHDVKLGEVYGESIKVIEGIEKGMNIVTPIIGLKDGASVRVKTN